MAKFITVSDVTEFCEAASSVTNSAIQTYIDMVDQADVCLDLNLVIDAVQKFLKLNAVCHYISQAGGGQVKSERDMDGASVTFETYQRDGYGLVSTTFGQNILNSGNSTCFGFMDAKPSRFMVSMGR